MDEQTAGQPPVRKEKRRGSRSPVVVFVEAKWRIHGFVKRTNQTFEGNPSPNSSPEQKAIANPRLRSLL